MLSLVARPAAICAWSWSIDCSSTFGPDWAAEGSGMASNARDKAEQEAWARSPATMLSSAGAR